MSGENEAVPNNELEEKSVDGDQESGEKANQDIDAKELQAEIERLRKHNERLLSEKKSTQEKAKEVKAEAERLERERLEKEGDYKTLLEKTEAEKLEAEKRFQEYQEQINTKEVSFKASKAASEIAIDKDAAELLSPYFEKRLKNTDNGVVVLDSNGNPTNQTVEDLIGEFKNTSKFKYLIAGSGASGGGASGVNSGGQMPNNVPNVKAQEAKSKGDLTGYIAANLKV